MSIVGLFWFNDDYTAIDEPVGTREFNSTDVSIKKRVLPIGNHAEHVPIANYKPRGRVMLINGKVKIFVGEKCPASAIELVIDKMDLISYKDNIEITRHYHWNATWEIKK